MSRNPRPMRAPAASAVLWGIAALCASAAACRTPGSELRVNTKPQGAEVRIDGRRVGTTPHVEKFLHYGERRVALYLDGYLSDVRVLAIEPPWYRTFPLDLITETLLGGVIGTDVHRHTVQLVPGTGEIPEPDLKGVLERAEALRRAGPEGPPGLAHSATEKPAAPDPEAQGDSP